MTTRAEFQQRARDRIRDAKVLLAGKRWSAAYYLAGYAVECALKSCIIRYLMATDAFLPANFSQDCYTHDLTKLLGLAELNAGFKAACEADGDLEDRWKIVKDWRETKRYERASRANAVLLYEAITNVKHGVLPWIKQRW